MLTTALMLWYSSQISDKYRKIAFFTISLIQFIKFSSSQELGVEYLFNTKIHDNFQQNIWNIQDQLN